MSNPTIKNGRRKKTTNPEDAGKQNIPASHIKRHKEKDIDDGDRLNAQIIDLLKQSFSRSGTCTWTPAMLYPEIIGYFEYCEEQNMKPCKSGLQLWLGVSSSQYYDWAAKPEKYGRLSDLIKSANLAMETQYINRGEKNPTMNIFLLKASFNYIEQGKLDITTNGESLESSDDVKQKLAKMGLAKKED
jgi:hypothetical protein